MKFTRFFSVAVMTRSDNDPLAQAYIASTFAKYGRNGWMILDPTNYSSPIDANRIGPNEFVALYSYSAGGKYVHTAAGLPKAKAESKYGDHI